MPDQMQPYAGSSAAPANSALVRWVIATGLVKDEQGANYVLIGFVVLAVGLALVIPSFMGPAGPHASGAQVDAAMRHALPTTTP